MKFNFVFALTIAIGLVANQANADLIAYHSLDNSTGLTFGAPQAGTNDASIVGGGLFGSALSLDGAGDFAETSTPTSLGTGSRTASIWFNQNTGTGGLRSAMTLGSNGVGTKFDIDIDNDNGGLEVGIGNGRSIDSGASINSGSWQHAVAVMDAGGNIQSVTTFLDGTQRNNTTTQTTSVNTFDTRWLFGTSANVGTSGNPEIQFFNGLVDDGAIWDEALTTEEIVALGFVGTSSLGYTADRFDLMKQVHDAGTGSVTIDGTTWEFATGIGANSTNAVIFGNAGSGLVISAVPEPSSFLAFASIGCIIAFKRRRR